VTLDLGGYRKRQEEKLREMAIDTANEAVASGQEAVIPGLKAYERRVVHTTLADRPDIETYSEGEGEQRQIIISPKVG
jgi:spoIIIJ-associated protein